ncbi:unnamed protein product [Mytilus coruscus]|uniref:Uncharacterized protein n=1 Tax=Mytilus coruscus TaxID=42192 RepID=A0A6J8CKE7_MYTCO|nr:unnamed protein product [Mytilus coruscus]
MFEDTAAALKTLTFIDILLLLFYWLIKIYKDNPITPFGHLIHNKDDSRRRPLHNTTDITQITFMAVILKLKCKYSISVEDVNELLLLFQKVAPKENIIPKTITEIDRVTKDLLVQHEEHIICACEEYRFTDRQTCEICNQDRSVGTKYYTIPVGPRLQQLREVKSLARLTALMECIPEKSRFVADLHESSSWATFSKQMGKNAIALSYCSDGFNPFHHIISQGSYSIWAQSSLILNLPQHMRAKTGTTLLLGLISGPRAPKKLNKYNEILVNELVQLKDGLATFNGDIKQRGVVKVGLLFMVGDVPGMAKEQNRVQQNAKTSCSHCTIAGVHSCILDKTVYPGGRRFLDVNHPLRHDALFPSGTSEEEEKRQQGKSTDTLASAIAQQTGRYGSNHWFRLGLDMQQQHAPVEPMHAIKVVAEHTIKLLNGDEDGAKVRAAERASGRNAELCPDAVYRIYVKEKKSLGQPEKKKDVAEVEESSILQTKYPKNELPQAPYLFSNGITRFLYTRNAGYPQRTSLVNFLLVLEEAYGCSFDMDLIDNFEKRWHEALCLMERDFPAALQRQYQNNQYPELSAIKKVEVQWLITLLDSAGFFRPIKVEAAKLNSQLSAGRFKPETRHLTADEMPHIQDFYQSETIQREITIYHHASNKKGTYRDVSIEKPTQREQCSVIMCNNCVGRIQFFFKNDTKELVWVSWIGYLEEDEDSKCYFVTPSDNLPIRHLC